MNSCVSSPGCFPASLQEALDAMMQTGTHTPEQRVAAGRVVAHFLSEAGGGVPSETLIDTLRSTVERMVKQKHPLMDEEGCVLVERETSRYMVLALEEAVKQRADSIQPNASELLESVRKQFLDSLVVMDGHDYAGPERAAGTQVAKVLAEAFRSSSSEEASRLIEDARSHIAETGSLAV